jgi:Ca2+-binding RTX toxin-like protein
MTLQQLTRSAVIAFILAGLVTFLPGLRKIQLAEAAGTHTPLSRVTEVAVLATQAQESNCASRARIVQECSLAALPGIQALEQQVIADLLAIHQLPAGGGTTVTDPFAAPQDNASRLLSWERDTLRALLFAKISVIIAKAPAARTVQEQAIVDALAARVRQTRVTAATEARNFYNLWQGGPCTFTPPAGFSYSPPTHCFIPNSIGSIFQSPPSLEQFQAYGAFVANERFSTDADLQAAAANTAKAYGLLAGIAAVGIAAAIAASFVVGGSSAVIGLLTWAVIHSGTYVFAGGYASFLAAIPAVGVAAAVLIALLSVAIAVVAGITIFTAAETPAKLDAAIAAAQATPDLKALLDTDAGKNEIFAAYIAATVPTVNGIVGGLNGWSPVPVAQPGDQQFVLDPGPSQQVSPELVFKSWDGTGRARLSQGWIVDQTIATAPALTLDIDYINHAGEQWTASRVGDHFLHTTLGNTKPAFESDVIEYQDAAGANRSARILPGHARPTANPTYAPPANAAGWHTGPVTVNWNWVDNAGVGLDPAACPATSTLNPGEIGATVICTDRAGNQGSATAIVRIDTTPPVFTGPPTLNPAPNAAGWNNADVYVSFACNDGDPTGIRVGGDAISGIASCGPGRSLTSEGRDQSVTATATDVAGNTTTRTFGGINIDKTPPRFVYTPADLAAGGAIAADGRVTAPAATDNLDPAPVVTCTPAVGTSLPQEPTRVTCTATDAAGNASTVSFTVAGSTTTVIPSCNGTEATIVARPGVPTVGTSGRDVIVGTDGPDEIRGGDGDDLICGAGGDDRIFGEGGDDTLLGDAGNDTLDGGAGQDLIYGGAGDDRLLGGAGDDWLEDREGMSQTFDGGAGTLNRCLGVSTAPPAGSVTNCQVQSR